MRLLDAVLQMQRITPAAVRGAMRNKALRSGYARRKNVAPPGLWTILRVHGTDGQGGHEDPSNKALDCHSVDYLSQAHRGKRWGRTHVTR